MDSISELSTGLDSLPVDDIPGYLQAMQTSALQCIEKEENASALAYLAKNEELLEYVKTRHIDIDSDYILATLHNTAYCHQQLGATETSASYLEACTYNIVTSKRRSSKPGDMFKRKKYECRARIQLCAMLSHLNKHEGALTHAKLSVKLSHSLLSDAMNLCFDHTNRHKKLVHFMKQKPGQERVKQLESATYRHSHELVKKAYPVLQLMEARVSSRRIEVDSAPPKLEMRSILGVQHYDDWIYSFNVGDLIKLQPLTLFELKSSLEAFAELTRDLMLDKLCMLIVGYYCLATELRLLYGRERIVEAHEFHFKAMQLAKDLLPIESPLLEHLKSSYKRQFAGVAMDAPRTSRSPQQKRGDVSCSRKRHSGSKSPIGGKTTDTNQKPRSTSAKSKRTHDRPKSPNYLSPYRRRLEPRLKPPAVKEQRPQLTDRKLRKPKNLANAVHTKSESSLTEGLKAKPMRKLQKIAASRPAESPENSDSELLVITSNELYGSRAVSPEWGGVESSIEVRPVPISKSRPQNRVISSTGGH